MIRTFHCGDIEAVMSIWLNANLEAHDFVDPDYWKSCFPEVKKLIPQAEVYVSEGCGGINGFIGLVDSYIAGIFVEHSARSAGIGSSLLSRAKTERKTLSLNVYQKNAAAVSFYRRRGFQITAERLDPQTSEIEYAMVWHG